MLSRFFKIIKISFGFSILLFGGCFLANKQSLVIESEESKTKDLTSVFNEITWQWSPKQDVWMMNQSHYGRYASKDKWERLAIVIDKTKRPMTAKYYQIKSGPLVWNDSLIKERLSYRASCFTCHANGPRAIRPIKDSHEASLSLTEEIKMTAWNLRIKTYGRIEYDRSHEIEDVVLSPPFRYSAPRENERLEVKTCHYCHKNEGFFARGYLLRQQSGTIKHMVKSGIMPPPGFKLSPAEEKQIDDFLKGF